MISPQDRVEGSTLNSIPAHEDTYLKGRPSANRIALGNLMTG